jgi:hypothetical protein
MQPHLGSCPRRHRLSSTACCRMEKMYNAVVNEHSMSAVNSVSQVSPGDLCPRNGIYLRNTLLSSSSLLSFVCEILFHSTHVHTALGLGFSSIPPNNEYKNLYGCPKCPQNLPESLILLGDCPLRAKRCIVAAHLGTILCYYQGF